MTSNTLVADVPNLREALSRPLLFQEEGQACLYGDGPDLIPLLQRLSTGDLLPVQDGEGRATVLTSPKGRIVQRLFVHPLGGSGVLLIGGRNTGSKVLDHLSKYTFAEQTGLRDASKDWEALALCGPELDRLLERCGCESPSPYGQIEGSIAGFPVWLLGHDGEDPQGRTILTAPKNRPAVEAALHGALREQGGFVADTVWIELVRIVRGIPVSGSELTEEANPLEAGLWEAVSFSKGCYVGQEVVARLNTYDKVSRVLMGIEIEELPESSLEPAPATAIVRDGRNVGRLTRFARIPASRRCLAMAYVKKRGGSAGDRVLLGSESGIEGVLRELPLRGP